MQRYMRVDYQWREVALNSTILALAGFLQDTLVPQVLVLEYLR